MPSRQEKRPDLLKPLGRELLHRVVELAPVNPLFNELLQPDTITIVRDLDEWHVSLVATLLIEEFRRQPPTPRELVVVRRTAEAPAVETGLRRYGLVVQRAGGR